MVAKTVSAVVPVYREEKNAVNVIVSLLNSGMVFEVVCVVDEPTVNCLKMLRSLADKIKLITFKKCRGKGRALASGVRASRGEIVMFLDSDLIGLSEKNVSALLAPVLSGRYRISVGAPLAELKNVFGKWVPAITGDRVYHRVDLLAHLTKMAKKGYGVELFLSQVFKKEKNKIVPLIGVINPYKEEKWSTAVALKRYLTAAADLLQELGRAEIKPPVKIKTLAELTTKIEELGNRDVKEVFQKYFLRYLDYAKKLTPKIKI
jgi:glycosyltransferase involved in cell wall biosynthesis